MHVPSPTVRRFVVIILAAAAALVQSTVALAGSGPGPFPR
jgi:hypothetical protein